MTKHSRHEREGRAAENERMLEVQRAWQASIPPAVAADFAREVAAAEAREPVTMPDMAPGTAPRPPRPGREPKPAKEETRNRR